MYHGSTENILLSLFSIHNAELNVCNNHSKIKHAYVPCCPKSSPSRGIFLCNFLATHMWTSHLL